MAKKELLFGNKTFKLFDDFEPHLSVECERQLEIKYGLEICRVRC